MKHTILRPTHSPWMASPRTIRQAAPLTIQVAVIRVLHLDGDPGVQAIHRPAAAPRGVREITPIGELTREAEMENTAAEIRCLQGWINDLISVLALPTVCSGHRSPRIVSTLLDVLLGMLRLDLPMYGWRH